MKLSVSTESLALSLLLFASQSAALPPWQHPRWQHPDEATSSSTGASSDGLTVQTAAGLTKGFVNSSYPDVRQFLGVPYAKAPTGSLRFEPPEALVADSNTQVQATNSPKACPQIAASTGNVFPSQFFNQAPWDEDCLSLSIWAPKANASSGLPVIIWIHGLGLQQGSSRIEYQQPPAWIQRSQEHIVVAVQYRLNIFGFPNGAGLNRTNLGLLDQRMGMEWVRDNIAAFGGDPKRMVLWGQSSGAGAVDAQNFAFPTDPIVQGFISDSGSALYPLGSGLTTIDPTYSNFSTVAKGLGCPPDPAGEPSCMRSKPAKDIIDFLTNYTEAMTTPTLNFIGTPDDIIAFANYTDRYAKGLLSDKPSIFGSNTNEGVIQVPPSTDPVHMGPNQTLADMATLGFFQCPAYASALERASAQRKTYLFQYGGNFTDLSPLFWQGAYHMSELPQVFGTRGLYNGAASSFEVETSNTMQDMWLAFAKDPQAADSPYSDKTLFIDELDSLLNNPSGVPVYRLVQVLLILALANGTHLQNEAPIPPSSVYVWCDLASSVPTTALELGECSLDILRVAALLNTAKQTLKFNDTADYVYSGAGVRLAMMLGLNRPGELDAEKKQLWETVRELELHACLACGAAPTVPPGTDLTVLLPWPLSRTNGHRSSVEGNDPSSLQPLAILRQSLQTRTKIAVLVNNEEHLRFEDVMSLSRDLALDMDPVPDRPSTCEQSFADRYVSFIYHKYTVALHRPFATLHDPEFYLSRDISRKCARRHVQDVCTALGDNTATTSDPFAALLVGNGTMFRVEAIQSACG